MCFNFSETKTVYIKLVPETVHYISFTLKFIWNHQQKYFLQLKHHIELLVAASVKLSISGENASWNPGKLVYLV